MCNWYQYSIQFFTLAIYMMTLTSYCKKVTNMQGHIFAIFIVMQQNQILFLHLIYSSNVFEFICAIKFYFFFPKLKNCNYIICRYDASNNWSAWCWRLHILPRPLDKLQHSICRFLIYSFGDNIMQKTICMSFFVNHMYFYLTYALKNLHVHLLYSSVILCVVISQVLKG